MPWSSTEVTTWASSALVQIVTSPPSGLNFTALWTRLTMTWPSRVASPRIGGKAGGVSKRNVTPWRSANRRSRSAESAASRPHVDAIGHLQRAATLDPAQVEQLVDHLHEVTRLDLDLGDPVAHLGRDGRAHSLRLPLERLGQQADRRQRRA